MSLINPQLPKQYKNGKVLFEQNLDAWRLAAEQAFATVNLNLTQLRKDCFLANYDFNNNGVAVLPKSLQEQINDLTTGATPISGTLSATWTINSGGNSLILSSAGLTADRTFTFPDLNGQVVTINATQTLVNKTLSAPTITNAIMSGVTVFDSGSAALPSIAGSGDLNTGAYWAGANQFAITADGSQTFLFTNTHSFSVNPFYLPDGAVGAPGLAFNSQNTLGIYKVAADKMGFTSNSTLICSITSDSLVFDFAGSAAIPNITDSIGSSGIYLAGAFIGFSTSFTARFTINDSVNRSINPLTLEDGSLPNLALRFFSDSDNGLYRNGANNYIFVCGGSDTIALDTAKVSITKELELPDVNPPTANLMNRNSSAKGWCSFDGVSLAASTSYNISTVTRNFGNPGDYTITLNTDFAAADYIVSAIATVNPIGVPLIATVVTKNAGSFRITFQDPANTQTDPDVVDIVVFGVQ